MLVANRPASPKQAAMSAGRPGSAEAGCRIALTRPPFLVAVDHAIAFDLTRLSSPPFFFTIYLS